MIRPDEGFVRMPIGKLSRIKRASDGPIQDGRSG